MANDSKDISVLGHIDGLAKEEEQLYAKQELTDEDRDRLEKIKIELDQYWDLLRQRRALREFGRDPNQAKVRPPDVVSLLATLRLFHLVRIEKMPRLRRFENKLFYRPLRSQRH